MKILKTSSLEVQVIDQWSTKVQQMPVNHSETHSLLIFGVGDLHFVIVQHLVRTIDRAGWNVRTRVVRIGWLSGPGFHANDDQYQGGEEHDDRDETDETEQERVQRDLFDGVCEGDGREWLERGCERR